MMTEVLWSSAGTSFTTQFLKILETPAFKITCLHNVIICVCKRKIKCLLEHRRPFFSPFWFIYLITQKKENWIFMGPLLGFENVTTTPLCPLNEPTRSGKKSVNCIFKAKDWLLIYSHRGIHLDTSSSSWRQSRFFTAFSPPNHVGRYTRRLHWTSSQSERVPGRQTEGELCWKNNGSRRRNPQTRRR